MSPSDANATDAKWMQRAIELAEQATKLAEVPVGALLVNAAGEIVGEGFNRRESAADPTAHAEILTLRAAAKQLGGWRLNDTTLYVTLEPCAMCAGALVNARVNRLVYGCADPKAGAVTTLFNICNDPRLNHRLKISGGVLEQDCAALLSEFFARLRNKPE